MQYYEACACKIKRIYDEGREKMESKHLNKRQ
jgi:hypothetical protein